MGTRRGATYDHDTDQLQGVLRARLAQNLGDPGEVEGAALSAAFVGATRPDWMPKTRSLDPVTGVFNASARTLPATRKAISAARTGASDFHVSVIGDSIIDWQGAGTTRISDSVPARMGLALQRKLGLATCGTGIIVPWGRSIPASGVSQFASDEPRLWYSNGGTMSTATYGMFQASTKVTSTASILGFAPGVDTDELWLYFVGSASIKHVRISTLPVDDSGFDAAATYFQVVGYPTHVFTPTGGATKVDAEPGYIRGETPSSQGGLVVAKITMPSIAKWNVRITGSDSQVLGVEARTAASGLRVSNLALAGMKLSDLVWNGNDINGVRGLPFAVNAPLADLLIQELHINDWQAHGSVDTLKTNLRSVVDRQRATGPAGTYGYGVGPGGDVMFLISAQPDYAIHPADHVQVPPLSDYYAAIYDVAIEKDVPVVDNAWRWVDYATSVDLYRDGIHPNNVGADDIGTALAQAIATIA